MAFWHYGNREIQDMITIDAHKGHKGMCPLIEGIIQATQGTLRPPKASPGGP